MNNLSIVAVLGIQALILAAAWGDLRRQVASNRELQDKRHEENVGKLDAIAADVRRINGTVLQHNIQIAANSAEIERLRGHDGGHHA